MASCAFFGLLCLWVFKPLCNPSLGWTWPAGYPIWSRRTRTMRSWTRRRPWARRVWTNASAVWTQKVSKEVWWSDLPLGLLELKMLISFFFVLTQLGRIASGGGKGMGLDRSLTNPKKLLSHCTVFVFSIALAFSVFVLFKVYFMTCRKYSEKHSYTIFN